MNNFIELNDWARTSRCLTDVIGSEHLLLRLVDVDLDLFVLEVSETDKVDVFFQLLEDVDVAAFSRRVELGSEVVCRLVVFI